jgi:hypothetical protein
MAVSVEFGFDFPAHAVGRLPLYEVTGLVR